MDLLVKEDYPGARSEFQKVVDLDPEQPDGHFFLAASYQMEMLDYETNDREKEFYGAVDQAVKKARQALVKDPRDAWANFYLGASWFYRAAYEGKRERYWTSVQSGLKGLSALRAAAANDSTLYDADLGLGSYDYFRTKATQVLSKLPFIGDTREKGIAEIRLAMEQGKYTGSWPRTDWSGSSSRRSDTTKRISSPPSSSRPTPRAGPSAGLRPRSPTGRGTGRRPWPCTRTCSRPCGPGSPETITTKP